MPCIPGSPGLPCFAPASSTLQPCPPHPTPFSTGSGQCTELCPDPRPGCVPRRPPAHPGADVRAGVDAGVGRGQQNLGPQSRRAGGNDSYGPGHVLHADAGYATRTPPLSLPPLPSPSIPIPCGSVPSDLSEEVHRALRALCEKWAILDPFSSILQRFLNHCCCLAKYSHACSRRLLQDIILSTSFPFTSPTFSFSMDLSIGDRVLYTRSNSVWVPARVVENAPDGYVHL